jgi:hypothetical protein
VRVALSRAWQMARGLVSVLVPITPTWLPEQEQRERHASAFGALS